MKTFIHSMSYVLMIAALILFFGAIWCCCDYLTNDFAQDIGRFVKKVTSAE